MGRNQFRAAEKGLGLPSYKDQSSNFVSRQQWVSLTGKKQRIKNLRSLCKDVLSSTDPEIIESIEKTKEFVKGKFEEYGLLMMVYQAKETSDSTGLSFPECLDYILEKIKADLSSGTVEGDKPPVAATVVDPKQGETESDDSRTGDEVALVDPGKSPTSILIE